MVTLRDALNKMGNFIEVGDFTKNGQGSKSPASESFVVGANGDFYPKNVTTMNKYTPDTPFSELPFGVTFTPINIEIAKQTNVPEEIAGVLVNYKTVNNDTFYSGFNRQEYHIFGRDKVYKRFLQSGGEFSEWTLSGHKERHEISNNITIQANSQTNVVVDSVGVRISDLVIVTHKYPLPSNIFFNYSVGGDNVLRIHLFNFGSQDLSFDKDWFVDIIKQ